MAIWEKSEAEGHEGLGLLCSSKESRMPEWEADGRGGQRGRGPQLKEALEAVPRTRSCSERIEPLWVLNRACLTWDLVSPLRASRSEWSTGWRGWGPEGQQSEGRGEMTGLEQGGSSAAGDKGCD